MGCSGTPKHVMICCVPPLTSQAANRSRVKFYADPRMYINTAGKPRVSLPGNNQLVPRTEEEQSTSIDIITHRYFSNVSKWWNISLILKQTNGYKWVTCGVCMVYHEDVHILLPNAFGKFGTSPLCSASATADCCVKADQGGEEAFLEADGPFLRIGITTFDSRSLSSRNKQSPLKLATSS